MQYSTTHFSQKNSLTLYLLWRHSSVTWQDPVKNFHQKLRKGCPISYAKFQHDPTHSSACIAKNLRGSHGPPPARARVNLLAKLILNEQWKEYNYVNVKCIIKLATQRLLYRQHSDYMYSGVFQWRSINIDYQYSTYIYGIVLISRIIPFSMPNVWFSCQNQDIPTKPQGTRIWQHRSTGQHGKHSMRELRKYKHVKSS